MVLKYSHGLVQVVILLTTLSIVLPWILPSDPATVYTQVSRAPAASTVTITEIMVPKNFPTMTLVHTSTVTLPSSVMTVFSTATETRRVVRTSIATTTFIPPRFVETVLSTETAFQTATETRRIVETTTETITVIDPGEAVLLSSTELQTVTHTMTNTIVASPEQTKTSTITVTEMLPGMDVVVTETAVRTSTEIRVETATETSTIVEPVTATITKMQDIIWTHIEPTTVTQTVTSSSPPVTSSTTSQTLLTLSSVFNAVLMIACTAIIFGSIDMRKSAANRARAADAELKRIRTKIGEVKPLRPVGLTEGNATVEKTPILAPGIRKDGDGALPPVQTLLEENVDMPASKVAPIVAQVPVVKRALEVKEEAEQPGPIEQTYSVDLVTEVSDSIEESAKAAAGVQDTQPDLGERVAKDEPVDVDPALTPNSSKADGEEGDDVTVGVDQPVADSPEAADAPHGGGAGSKEADWEAVESDSEDFEGGSISGKGDTSEKDMSDAESEDGSQQEYGDSGGEDADKTITVDPKTIPEPKAKKQRQKAPPPEHVRESSRIALKKEPVAVPEIAKGHKKPGVPKAAESVASYASTKGKGKGKGK